MADETLYHVDLLAIDGKPIGIEEGSATIQGAAGFSNTVVPNSNINAPDGLRRSREPRGITASILFKPSVSVDDIRNIKNAQMSLRDLQSGRRCLARNVNFGSMGEIGNGSLRVTFAVLEPYQWL